MADNEPTKGGDQELESRAKEPEERSKPPAGLELEEAVAAPTPQRIDAEGPTDAAPVPEDAHPGKEAPAPPPSTWKPGPSGSWATRTVKVLIAWGDDQQQESIAEELRGPSREIYTHPENEPRAEWIKELAADVVLCKLGWLPAPIVTECLHRGAYVLEFESEDQAAVVDRARKFVTESRRKHPTPAPTDSMAPVPHALGSSQGDPRPRRSSTRLRRESRAIGTTPTPGERPRRASGSLEAALELAELTRAGNRKRRVTATAVFFGVLWVISGAILYWPAGGNYDAPANLGEGVIAADFYAEVGRVIVTPEMATLDSDTRRHKLYRILEQLESEGVSEVSFETEDGAPVDHMYLGHSEPAPGQAGN